MYLMPAKRPRTARRLGILPATTPGIMPRRIPAVLATARAYGLQLSLSGLGALPSANVTSFKKLTPAIAAARISRQQGARTRKPRRRLSGLSDDPTWINPGDTLTPNYSDGPARPLVLSPSVPAAGQPSDPVTVAWKNALTAAQTSQNPLDYVSPNAAKAAGLNPAAVDAAWAKGLARFRTAQDAVNAGINAGVVKSFWAKSRNVGPSTSSITSWLASNWQVVAAVGGGALLLGAMSGGKR
jgi:hypothetical protein